MSCHVYKIKSIKTIKFVQINKKIKEQINYIKNEFLLIKVL